MNTLNGHPKALYLLFVTEMWERFSYYGMRALFVLYMTQALLLDKEYSSEIYGSYTGLVYLTPLLGGYIADRYWGNRRSILVGSLMMALGQFFMYLSACYYHNVELAKWLMFCGLGVLILGNGFFKPNISTMVGDLYEAGDKRKDSAFTIFYMGVNLGATIAPLWCGLVGNTGNPEDFKWGFLSACIGMLIGAAVFQYYKDRCLCMPDGTPIGMPVVKEVSEEKKNENQNSASIKVDGRIILSILISVFLVLFFSFNWESLSDNTVGYFSGADWIGSIIYATIIMVPSVIITDKSLTCREKKQIGIIFVLAFFVIFFWAAYEQAGASLTFFADEQTDRMIWGWEMPASYFQSFGAVFIVLLAPVFASLWSFLNKHNIEPSSPMKQAIGLFLLSMGYLLIAFGVKGVEPGMKVSIMWLTSLYFIHTMGELCLAPIGLSLVYRLSPARFSSLLMGVWYLSTSAANKLAGLLSGYYPEEGVEKAFLGYTVSNLFDFFLLFVLMNVVFFIIVRFLYERIMRIVQG